MTSIERWLDFFFKHFWKVLALVLIILWALGVFPMPDPKDLLDFLKEIK
jgi:hypothetical protein